MSLLQLPPELLIQIFDHVGSSYFRSDLSRLTVCKQWIKFAYTTCFRDFYVTQKTLRRLLSSPYMESSLLLVTGSAEALKLDLKGYEDWDSTPLPAQDSQAANVLDVSAWDGSYGYAVRTAWTTELNDDLFYLATIMRQSPKLRTLRVQATSELQPTHHFLERRDYLFQSTIRAFLSANNLTSLELDLCGTRLIQDVNQDHKEGFHICTSIAALLTTLRRLRLRMRSICADSLKPHQGSTKLPLSEILINLSLSNESTLTTSAAHATCCLSSIWSFLELKADIEKQTQALVAQMAAPKMVRILTHSYPRFDMRAFDVLTGRNIILSEGAEWNDEGQEEEEDLESDKESEISSLSDDDG